MSAHDDLLTAWRDKLAEGMHDDCTQAESLRPDSYCVVFDMCWGGPDCGTATMLTPEYFDSPADFVAYVRVVELPRSLEMLCGPAASDAAKPDDTLPPAEAFVSRIDQEAQPLAEAVIVAADAALAKPEVTAADAEAVITAFNALFGREDNAQFIAWGAVSAVFGTPRITDSFDAWSADADDLLSPEEPEMIVKRLLDAGEFDAGDPEQLEMARGMLALFPLC